MKSKNSRKARAITRRSIVKHGRLRRSGDSTLPLPKQYRDQYKNTEYEPSYSLYAYGSWSDLFERNYGRVTNERP